MVEHSADLGELFTALAAFQAAAPTLAKTRQGEIAGTSKSSGKDYSYKYTYADFASVVETVREALGANGLAVAQFPSQHGLVTVLAHSSGQFMADEMPISPGLSAQALGSAISYARRYSFLACLGLVADEDDDGAQAQAAGKERAPARSTGRPGTKTTPSPSPGPREVSMDQIAAADQRDRMAAARPATEAQLKALGTLMTKLGIADRQARLDLVAQETGRTLESSKELTVSECSKLIDSLSDEVAREAADSARRSS